MKSLFFLCFLTAALAKVVEKRQAFPPWGSGTAQEVEGMYENCPQVNQCFSRSMAAEECLMIIEDMSEDNSNSPAGRLEAELEQLYESCFMDYPDDVGPPLTSSNGFNNNGFNSGFNNGFPASNNQNGQSWNFGGRRKKRQASGMSAAEKLEDQLYRSIQTADEQCEQMAQQQRCQMRAYQKEPCEIEIEQKEAQLAQLMLPLLQSASDCVQRALQNGARQNTFGGK